MSLGKTLLMTVVPPIARFVLVVLGLTWRIEVRGYGYFAAAKKTGRPIVGGGMHGRLFILTWVLSRPQYGRWRILRSPSSDGEFIDRVGGGPPLRFLTAVGSSGRDGARGFIQLVRSIRSEPEIGVGFLVDGGKRGPRGRVKPGVVQLAKKCNAWLIPASASGAPGLVARSWDRFQVPGPFAKVAVTFGRPRLVCGDDEAVRQRFEDDLAAITTACDRRVKLRDKTPVRA
ncbi:MAG: hypothetical protein PF961_11075 [Planctomycetota bacterium]|jgi:lysophospholipid acyltransferase (LPLAT)-like uncharacterized protein|nr:hypothetical protein [Planctomycetota bacterium]